MENVIGTLTLLRLTDRPMNVLVTPRVEDGHKAGPQREFTLPALKTLIEVLNIHNFNLQRLTPGDSVEVPFHATDEDSRSLGLIEPAASADAAAEYLRHFVM